MIEFQCSDASSIRIDELFDLDIEVHSVTITEALFGYIPTIEVKFGANNEVELFPINKVLTGYLRYPSGLKDEFEGFIYSISRNLNEATLKLMCCEPTFTKNLVLSKYTTIDSALQSVWHGNRLDEIKTDILDFEDPYYIYQKCETNYHLCNRLCRSYKYNTLFGYLLSGLRLIDLSNPVPIELSLLDQADFKLTQAPVWSDPKLHQFDSISYVDYNHVQAEYELDENHISVRHYTGIITVDNPYKELLGNYLYNQKLENSKQLNMFTLNNLKDIHIGDFINISSNQLVFHDTFITKRIIMMTQSDIKVDYEIQSINPHE